MNSIRPTFESAAWLPLNLSDFSNGIQAVFFDCDGVIMEKQPAAYERWSKLFRANAPRLLDGIRRRSGSSSRRARTVYEPLLGCRLTGTELELLSREFSQLLDQQGEDPRLVRGAREYLETHFGRHDCFLISDTDQGCLEAFCQQHELSHFFREIAGGPRHRLRWIGQLLRAFGLKPECSVYVGGSLECQVLAAQAGLSFIGVGPEFVPGTSMDAPVIPDLSGLDRALSRLALGRPHAAAA